MRRLRFIFACALASAALGAAPQAPAFAADELRWSVVSRFGGAELQDRLDRFSVVVTPPRPACRALDAGRATWSVDGQEARRVDRLDTKEETGCPVSLPVQGEGEHSVELRGGGPTLTASVQIDDRLVVALGDSVASGEGNPASGGPRWLDAPCHRSRAAGFEQAARLLAEDANERSLTFVSLACSGAEVREGLLEPYAGVAPGGGTPYPPQVDVLGRLARARGGGVDAVLLSVGANDVRFSQIVGRCALPGDCRRGADARVFRDLEGLSGRYAQLESRLEEAVGDTPVLISEYFDPTRDERGRFCPSSVGLTTRAEAQFAYEALLRPLNAEVAAAARRHGWLLVDGIAADYERHGYCANRAERWVRRLERSLISQGDHVGTLHPNAKGHAAIAERVGRRLDGVLEFGVRAREPLGTEGLSTLEMVGLAAAVLLAIGAVAFLVVLLRGEPKTLWPLIILVWPVALIGLVVLVLFNLARRLLLLVRPTNRPDPSELEPTSPTLPAISAPTGLRDVLLLAGVVGVFLLVAVGLVAAVGAGILWMRFWAARLPADQAVDAVARQELVVTGAQAVALFAVLGLVAMVLVWLLDGQGQWVRATRRGLALLIVTELVVAILVDDFRARQAVELIAGFAIAAVLLYFLIERGLELVPALRTGASLWGTLLDRIKSLIVLPSDGAGFRWRWILVRPLPLLALAGAVYASVVADGTNRVVFIVLPILLAALLFVLPGGLASRPTGRPDVRAEYSDGLEPARMALALAVLLCVTILLWRDEAWLVGSAIVAAVLAGLCLAIAAASGQRFAPYGLAVLISVPVFGAAMEMLRTVNSPRLQPVAVLLRDDRVECGAYVGESDGRLWLARVELAELGNVRRPPPRRGRIVPILSSSVVERSLGPLQPVARAQDQAVVLRDELLDARGKDDPGTRPPGCVAKAPRPEPDPSPHRELAEDFQPELIVDREDGFWPIPVRTLFAMQDRRARACRLIGGDRDEPCVRLTTQGELSWSGGEGEAIEYPAANNRDGEQRDLMVDALGSVDPVKTAREYFLVAGDLRENRPLTLQYWFFYSFNYQPINETLNAFTAGFHEGDFESVGVLLSARTRRPRYVWMARHNDEGRMFTWEEDALRKRGDHPVVFVARGSHASYETCDRQPRFHAPGGLIDDQPTCKASRQLHLSPQATAMTDLSRTAWACWHGLFGHRSGKGYEQIPHLVNDAPRSPLWQQTFDDVVSEPCRGVEDPGDREGLGEEVVEENDEVPATLRKGAGRLERLVDECSDWEHAPNDGTYMVACDQDALRAYLESGLEVPGPAGLRIDDAAAIKPRTGAISLPAVRRDAAGTYLDGWRISASQPTRASVYASCRQDKRIVAARFPSVRIDPAWPLRLSDRAPGVWRLRREDGVTVAETKPMFVRGKKPKSGGRLFCSA
ncbi:MAG TPA: GDSL-type esterase/lipase family protein [Thermoleophilaceae bacterium]|nr:GDSL-type esterase/lipase family protein [Thermoleophilaceae bacterium]